ncbi:MAG: ATP-binding cassette domain-containing protein [Candidatus Methanomethylophilaceae archaeon]|nr:ATP-binding cassette domain-containing protein [Candidatus Methanomethylophilaceae archaeon]
MAAVSVRDLRKSYDDFEAVKGISFEVKEGSFFAFLGPNGAGKSTTISILCSLLDYNSGTVEVFGKNPTDARTEIGVVFQDHMLDDKLTVRENVALRGSMYGLKGQELNDAVDKVLALTDSDEFADRRYGNLSGGQKRRADIARALVHNPKMIILDEPTAGLDPQSRTMLWRTVFNLNRETGLTVFLTTHYMEEASDADDIVIIDHGEIVAQGTSDELKEQYCTDYIRAIPKDQESFINKLSFENIRFTVDKGIFTIPVKDTIRSIGLLNKFKDDLESFEVRKGTLDEAFIKITGGDDDE